jgi:diaminohydroxyphosphoribosylaminopyrimidine deaminase/5-amino-6-(5-phosphoribosylamino)uracil reductase
MLSMREQDKSFMQEALELARRGYGYVEPNPPVGAVIVRDGVVLGRGWHKHFGGPHAEIEALADAASAGRDVRGATVYVTLEPCCHHGKTPPCTDALIAAGIARVVAAVKDVDEKVAGKGFAHLAAAGVEVDSGVLEEQARELLRAYITLRTQRRPWVICKWAQTSDGLLALPAGEGRWISSPPSREAVQALRGRCDGVCVGVQTVLADDPLLTNRSGAGRQPSRLVLDSHLRTPADSRLVRTAKQFPLILACSASLPQPQADVLRRAGAEILPLPAGKSGWIDLDALLDELGRRQWTNLLVEGGACVLESFLTANIADELNVFISPRKAASRENLPRFDIAEVAARMHLPMPHRSIVGEDTLLRYVLRS